MNNPLTVVEVAMEIAWSAEFLNRVAEKYGPDAARACGMASSVGGIGPLLKERIASQSNMGVRVIGVRPLYDTVWVQGFYQWGQIYIEKKPTGAFVRNFLEDTGLTLKLDLPDATTAQVKVWKTRLAKADLYLLDCPEIGTVVYPGPEDAPTGHANPGAWAEEAKLNQSWLVGRGTLALLKALNVKPDILIQSETPTVFANHSLVTDVFQKDPFFEGTKYIFNDHTPLEYAHPIWDEAKSRKALLDPALIADRKHWSLDGRGIDVTRLLISQSHGVYGVAKKHGRVMRDMPSLRDLAPKIQSITNGVSVSDWQHPGLKDFGKMSDEELLAAREKNKSELIEWIWKRYRLWINWRQKVRGKCLVLWTRRVTSYKRFDVLDRLLKDPALRARFLKTDLVCFVGGRIHQNDNLSHNVMFELLDLVTRDEELRDRVLVLDNYNIWDAPRLFQGVDATIMLADDGREASATGFMKAQVNGAAVLASYDGAIPESVFFPGNAENKPVNGFEVPYVFGQPMPEGLMSAFESMDRAYKNPAERAQLIRGALAVCDQVSVDRTAREMIDLYHTL